MSSVSQEAKKNKSPKNFSGWDKAIADAKGKIKGLEFSIQVYEQSKREGRSWPGNEKAGTEGQSVPA